MVAGKGKREIAVPPLTLYQCCFKKYIGLLSLTDNMVIRRRGTRGDPGETVERKKDEG